MQNKKNPLSCKEYYLLHNLSSLHLVPSNEKKYISVGKELPDNPEFDPSDVLAVMLNHMLSEGAMVLVKLNFRNMVLYYYHENYIGKLRNAAGECVVENVVADQSLLIIGIVTSVVHTQRPSKIHEPTIGIPDFRPKWLREVEKENLSRVFPSVEAMVRFTILLAEKNVEHQTGGPFGAAVFSSDTLELVTAAVNLVVPMQQSCAHAEMTAIILTHQKLQLLDLKKYTIVTSSEPCSMCLGGILWSGMRQIIYGASEKLAEKIGFDEGDKIKDWKAAYQKRGIQITGPLLESEVEEVFKLYQTKKGKIY
ncbi:MAG: nucleoside deaminase [Lentisphaeria bacterium]